MAADAVLRAFNVDKKTYCCTLCELKSVALKNRLSNYEKIKGFIKYALGMR